MTTTTALFQSKIDTAQLLDEIEYALRSIKACGSAHYCTGPHAGQLARGCAAAGEFLDLTADTILYSQGGHGTAARLREAKTIAKATLAETNAAIKACGTLAQRRLAFTAEATHEHALAA